MKRALTFIAALIGALIYAAVTICLMPFAGAIWALSCVARGLEWIQERVA